MTSVELFEKLKPSVVKHYFAQLLTDGLSVNLSDMFSEFVKQAARCTAYNSDIFYDMKMIERMTKEFDPSEDFKPIWIGFRKYGVDCTDFVLTRVNNESVYGSLESNYFALYCIKVEKELDDFYRLDQYEYAV